MEILSTWQNSNKPVVSICVVTYNHSEYLSVAMESILMQKTNFAYEIIIGEDCSTDNTLDIVLNYHNRSHNLCS